MAKVESLQLELDRLADDGGPAAASSAGRGAASPWMADGPSPWVALEQLAGAFLRLTGALRQTARAEIDLVRCRSRNFALRCMALLGGGLFVVLTAVAAAVFLLSGLTGALYAMTPLPLWGAQMIVGIFTIGCAVGAVAIGMTQIQAASFRIRTESYLRRRRPRNPN